MVDENLFSQKYSMRTAFSSKTSTLLLIRNRLVELTGLVVTVFGERGVEKWINYGNLADNMNFCFAFAFEVEFIHYSGILPRFLNQSCCRQAANCGRQRDLPPVIRGVC